MNRVVLVLNFSRQSFAAFPGKAQTALRDAARWFDKKAQHIGKKALQIEHVSTLERFHNKEYGNKDDTIGVAEAFNKGLLDPQALLSALLVTQIEKLTDKTVLESWNQVTLEAMQSRTNGARPSGAIPLNAILRNAAYKGDCETLDWLVNLKNPTEPLHWDSRLLLMHNVRTARWALLGHSDLMDVPDPAYFIRTSLEPAGGWLPPDWLKHCDDPKTGYGQDRRQLLKLRYHLNNLMDTYFKDMPWQERWVKFANPLTPVSLVAPTIRRNGVQGLAQGHAIIAGLLYNAPLDVQKCLAAFKNSIHPDERTDLAYDIEPKAIRHALFGAPAPQGVVPVALVAWLSMMHGTPVEDVSNEWVQWHTNGPAKPAEMNIPLPCNVFEI